MLFSFAAPATPLDYHQDPDFAVPDEDQDAIQRNLPTEKGDTDPPFTEEDLAEHRAHRQMGLEKEILHYFDGADPS